MNKATISFYGGAGSVTGANFLFTVANKRILIDCGLEQGHDADIKQHNDEPFPYDPATIDFLFITHAHADHIGRIPKLVKDGFKGIIYSTPATLDLSRIMLPDTLRIIEADARRAGVLPMFELQDLQKTFELWKTIPYYQSFELGNSLSVTFKDAGHILGSAMVEITLIGGGSTSTESGKIVFTGDLGNSPSLFLRDTDTITDANYILMESVYGDRNHQSHDDRRHKFIEIIKDTVSRNRTLVIPAFSLERTQDILFELNEFIEQKQIAPVHIFLDSPLAIAVTDIYKKYSSEFKESAQKLLATDSNHDLFSFPNLKLTLEREESQAIPATPNPKIIIAGSGMSRGGRVQHHEKRYLPDKNATILMVGFQALGTLGRRIFDGATEVTIDGERIPVKAQIKSITGYSSHKDSDHLVDFVAKASEIKKLKKVFVSMGEPKSSLFLVQRLRDYLLSTPRLRSGGRL